MSEPTHGELAAALRDLAAEVRALGHSNGNGKTKLLTVDTLIKVLLALAALISYSQRVIDKMDYVEREVAAIVLWKDTTVQLDQNQDRRLTVLETRVPDSAITVRRR
jgi:hypothetical protein